MTATTDVQRSKTTVVRQCLTDSEQQHYGARLAASKIERDDITAAAKTTADEYKGKIGTKSAEIDRLARLVNDKKELRSIDCYRELHPGNRLVVIRSDTGEIVSSHPADLEDIARFRDEAEQERKRRAKAVSTDAPPAAPAPADGSGTDESEPAKPGRSRKPRASK